MGSVRGNSQTQAHLLGSHKGDTSHKNPKEFAHNVNEVVDQVKLQIPADDKLQIGWAASGLQVKENRAPVRTCQLILMSDYDNAVISSAQKIRQRSPLARRLFSHPITSQSMYLGAFTIYPRFAWSFRLFLAYRVMWHPLITASKILLRLFLIHFSYFLSDHFTYSSFSPDKWANGLHSIPPMLLFL